MRYLTTLVILNSVFSVEAGLAAPVSAPDARALIRSGDDLAMQDHLKEAISAFTQAVHADPKSSDAHQRLGHALAADHKFSEAEDELRSAVSLDPTNQIAHFDLGWVYGVRGAYRRAVMEERSALALKSNYAPAWANLGIALTRLEEFDQAASAFEQAIALEPQNVDNYINMAGLEARRGDFKAAVDYYRRAIAFDHADPNAHLGLAAALGKLGDQQGEIAELRKAAALAPDEAYVHGRLGFALYQAGDVQGSSIEGIVANGLRAQQASYQFFGTLLTAWAALFLFFGVVFGAMFFGSRFKAQQDETITRSFFLVFYKDRPGRFVLTNRRMVFVPEAFSQWFGSTRMSLEYVDVETFYSQSSITGGRLAILCTNGTVVHFAMPVLVLEPLLAELKKIHFGASISAQVYSEIGSTPEKGEEINELFEAPSFDPNDDDWIEVVANPEDPKNTETKSGDGPVANDNGQGVEARS